MILHLSTFILNEKLLKIKLYVTAYKLNTNLKLFKTNSKISMQGNIMVLLADSALTCILIKLIIFSFWFQITKMLNAKPEDVCVKSPLSKLRSSERWDFPSQGVYKNLLLLSI